ncbi:MAG: hypothetical protein ABSF87_12615 [Xanthobacteraceae bacterium]|jgi:hypothetical protein
MQSKQNAELVDAFELAREDNPGKWTRQFLLQLEAEREPEQERFLDQLWKEFLSGNDVSDANLRGFSKKLRRFLDEEHSKQHSTRNLRALDSAKARDRIDAWIANLKEAARKLKRTNTQPDVPTANHVDYLADTLIPIIEALETYEKIAEPKFTDKNPLNELAHVLFWVGFLSPIIDSMTKYRAKMARVRAERSSKSQDKYRPIDERAWELRERNPKWSVRRIADKLVQEFPKAELKLNTLEKRLAKRFGSRRKDD